MRHRPELDGIRGLAILLVIADHAGVPGLSVAGYVGVTVFFTLSGYLITALLLAEHERTTHTVVPRRATLHDVGTGLTHKRIICWKREDSGDSSILRSASLLDPFVTTCGSDTFDNLNFHSALS